MNKIDLLIIRACKHSDKRVVKVLESIYHAPMQDEAIAAILFNVIERHCSINCKELANALAPSYFDAVVEQVIGNEFNLRDWYYARLKNTLISHIRLTNISRIEGFVPPLYWRKKLNEEKET